MRGDARAVCDGVLTADRCEGVEGGGPAIVSGNIPCRLMGPSGEHYSGEAAYGWVDGDPAGGSGRVGCPRQGRVGRHYKAIL